MNVQDELVLQKEFVLTSVTFATLSLVMNRLLRLSLLLTLLPLSGQADEVQTAINSALASYKSGKNNEALDQLKQATELIQQKAGLSLSAAMPNKIGEWNGGKISTKLLDGLGGGQASERNYRKGDKDDPKSLTATLSIIAGSPTLTQVTNFLSNPALGALLGASTVQVGDTAGMFIKKEGLLQFVVEGKYLVAVRSKKGSEADIIEIAKGVDRNVLKALK